jgi:glycosyltransferase involved in cell wall biosynthesis
MGRQSAGEGLLRGYVRHAGVDTVVGYGGPGLGPRFEAAVRRAGGRQPTAWATDLTLGPAAQVGAVHLAGPGLAEAAWVRRGLGQRAFSITGVTHTVASARAMDSITELLAGPVQSWDALICTSRSVRAMVEVLLDDQSDYLAQRFGAAPGGMVRPQLPVIPLGVDVAAFRPHPQRRAALRQQLGVPKDSVLLLMAGRLSYHAKAHPHPMYMALQQAAQATGTRPHLLLASWFANEGQERVFRQGAAELCPDVTLHVLDGRQPGVWEAIWPAADAYTLLSDNIQESFGLAPVEAMAAGLPVVGADWDGLRDTVEAGVTGFLAPTLVPGEPSGGLLAQVHAAEHVTYDQYVGAVAQSTSVDVAAAAQGYAALLRDAGLRRRMGEAGRVRAGRLFDWGVVIPAYQALWAELAERRRAEAESAPVAAGRPPAPGRSDPFRHFGAHASARLTAGDTVEPAPTLAGAIAALAAREGAMVLPGALHTGAALTDFAAKLAPGGRVGDLLPGWAEDDRGARTLVWLAKHGAVRIRTGSATT